MYYIFKLFFSKALLLVNSSHCVCTLEEGGEGIAGKTVGNKTPISSPRTVSENLVLTNFCSFEFCSKSLASETYVRTAPLPKKEFNLSVGLNDFN
jgi:hypothetical protein